MSTVFQSGDWATKCQLSYIFGSRVIRNEGTQNKAMYHNLGSLMIHWKGAAQFSNMQNHEDPSAMWVVSIPFGDGYMIHSFHYRSIWIWWLDPQSQKPHQCWICPPKLISFKEGDTPTSQLCNLTTKKNAEKDESFQSCVSPWVWILGFYMFLPPAWVLKTWLLSWPKHVSRLQRFRRAPQRQTSGQAQVPHREPADLNSRISFFAPTNILIPETCLKHITVWKKNNNIPNVWVVLCSSM